MQFARVTPRYQRIQHFRNHRTHDASHSLKRVAADGNDTSRHVAQLQPHQVTRLANNHVHLDIFRLNALDRII